jgi:hypothetical protein
MMIDRQQNRIAWRLFIACLETGRDEPLLDFFQRCEKTFGRRFRRQFDFLAFYLLASE